MQHGVDTYEFPELGGATLHVPVHALDNFARCDVCQRTIKFQSGDQGLRCLECPDFDICAECHVQSPHDLSGHTVERQIPFELQCIVSHDYVDSPLDGAFADLARLPLDAFLTDSNASMAVCRASLDFFPWRPREGVEPAFWVGNLNASEHQAMANELHVRCMGLRMTDADPLDAPPSDAPPGYRYLGQSEVRQLQDFVLRFVNAPDNTKPAMKATETVGSASLADWSSGLLGPINSPCKRAQLRLLHHSIWQTTKEPPGEVVHGHDKGLARHWIRGRSRSCSVNDTLRFTSKRTGTREPWNAHLTNEWDNMAAAARSQSLQRSHEARAWLHRDLSGEREFLSQDTAERLPAFTWTSDFDADAYCHEPLPYLDSFRLAIILPSSVANAQIKCGLVQYRVHGQTPPSFVMLDDYSYQDYSRECYIRINGQPYVVTMAVEAWLRRVRHRTRFVFVYCRSLCLGKHMRYLPNHSGHSSMSSLLQLQTVEFMSTRKIESYLRLLEYSGSATAAARPDLRQSHNMDLRRSAEAITMLTGSRLVPADLCSKPMNREDDYGPILYYWSCNGGTRPMRTCSVDRMFLHLDSRNNGHLIGPIVHPKSSSRQELRRTRSTNVLSEPHAKALGQLSMVPGIGLHDLHIPHLLWQGAESRLSKVPAFKLSSLDLEEELNFCVLLPPRVNDAPGSMVKCGLMQYRWMRNWIPCYTFIQNSTALEHSTTTQILMNGRPFWIPQSLELFLRAIRQPGRPQLLFVWPLCVAEPALLAGSRGAQLESALKRASWRTIDVVKFLSCLSPRELTQLEQQRQREVHISKSLINLRINYSSPGDSSALYTLLDPASMDLRLIRLLPDEVGVEDPDESPIRLRMSSHAGSSVKYVALSYFWGDPRVNTEVEVNGRPVCVRQNLYDFLVHWRRLCRSREGAEHPPHSLLWIDALSINQNDPAEKAREIRRMDQIYTGAELVIVWFGKERSTDALPACFWERGPDAVRRNFSTLVSLFGNPYMSRSWCTQELAFAQKIFALLGNQLVAWSAISGLFSGDLSPSDDNKLRQEVRKSIKDLSNPAKLRISVMMNRLVFVDSLRQAVAQGHRPTLLSLLLCTFGCECSIACDIIYSLWALAADSAALVPQLDYTLTPQQVFTRFTLAWIEHYRRLDIVSLVRKSDADCLEGLPSWVRDWSATPRMNTVPVLLGVRMLPSTWNRTQVEADRWFSAGGNEPCDAKWVHDHLSCSGVVVDQIESMLNYVPTSTVVPGLRDFQHIMFNACQRHLIESKNLDPGRLGAAISDFLHACVFGTYHDGSRRVLDLAEAFDLDPESDTFGLFLIGGFKVRYSPWNIHMDHLFGGRCLAFTHGGQVGVVPRTARPGQLIAVLQSCSVPLILDIEESKNRFSVVGDCFFRRIMDGQLEISEWDRFELV